MFNRKKVSDQLEDVSDRLDTVREGVKRSERYRGWKALSPNMRLLIVVVVVAVVAFLVGHALDLMGVSGSIEVPRGEE